MIVALVKDRNQEIMRRILFRMGRKDFMIFTVDEDFYCYVKSNCRDVDYALVDVLCFQMDLFNPYIEFSFQDHYFPIVVFNDPFPDKDTRAAYWISKNKFYSSRACKDGGVDLFRYEFLALEQILNDPVINCHVPAISFCSDCNDNGLEDNQVDLEDTRKKMGIPPSRFCVMKYLFERKGRKIPGHDICIDLWNESSQKRRQVLYTYVYHLRKTFESHPEFGFSIEHVGKGCYQLNVKQKNAST